MFSKFNLIPRQGGLFVQQIAYFPCLRDFRRVYFAKDNALDCLRAKRDGDKMTGFKVVCQVFWGVIMEDAAYLGHVNSYLKIFHGLFRRGDEFFNGTQIHLKSACYHLCCIFSIF